MSAPVSHIDADSATARAPGADEEHMHRSAILATIAYRDIFDFPVTLAEIHRYLHGFHLNLQEIEQILAKYFVANGIASSDGQYYALKSREALFELRRARERTSEVFWANGARSGSLLASLPFVSMVAVTGSLAVDNAHDAADIDFMIVTAPDRLWTVRLVANLTRFVLRRANGNRMCPNFLVSEAALELKEKNLYAAQELTQMVPVYGRETYERLRDANDWTLKYLPNASGAPPRAVRCRPAFPRFRAVFEWLLGGRVGSAIETWESSRKLRRYNETAFLLGRYHPFSKEATGHRRNVQRTIQDAFENRHARLISNERKLCVLIGQAYHLAFDRKLWREMQPYPPLGALYAAGVAREAGHDVRCFDSMLAMSDEEWRIALQLNQPDVVVLYEDNFNYLTKMCLSRMREAALGMIADARRRDATVVVASSDASDHPEVYLEAGARYVICGEGEATLTELLAALHRGADAAAIGEISGLAYREGDGRLLRTAPRALIRRLDELPAPAWDLIDTARYREIWTRRHGRYALNMVTTRGCPYHCNWCAKPIWGQAYSARSPAHVVAELKWLSRELGADYVWFMDDIFGLKPGWVARFAGLLAEENLLVPFKCLSRPDLLLRNGEISALADAGCDIVWMGAESGSQSVLDAMEKGTSVEQVREACAKLRQAGIRIGLFIQFGYPGETRQDIRRTIALIREVLPDEMGVSVSYPLPGTKFFDRVRNQLGTKQHWIDSDDLAMLYRGPYRGTFYRALHRYVHRDLALRRAWRSIRSKDSRLRLGRRRLLRRVGGLGLHTTLRLYYRMQLELTAWVPNRGAARVIAELGRNSAATPTEQPRD